MTAWAFPSCVGGDVGDMKEYATKFYSSKAWKDCRREYAKSVRGLCERCLANGVYKAGEIVHHKTHINPENITDPHIILDWNNLELVCRSCHRDIHEGDMNHKSRKRRYKLDELGRVII